MLDPEVAFLNHGSFGATPRVVFEAWQGYQRDMERNPVDFFARRFSAAMREAREALAGFVGAAPENLVFVPNATTALNTVARGLALGPGDEIVTTDHEYGAMDRMWRFVCHKTGAVYKPVPVPLPVGTAEECIERIWSGVTERTRVLFVSHITSPTALTLPVAELCRRARAAGVLSVVDGAHVAGQLPLDLDGLGADVYTSNAHKWLCAPKGAAFLFVRPEVQPMVEPLVVSWGGEAFTPTGRPFLDEQQWAGTRDISAFLAVRDAIRFQREHDWDRVRRDCHALVRHARERIGALTGRPHLCPDGAGWFMQMAAMPLPDGDATVLGEELWRRFRIEVPIVCRQGRNLLRVSVQAYNTADDIERLAAGLEQLLGGTHGRPCGDSGKAV
jgi:isopenicillin-N epimerase